MPSTPNAANAPVNGTNTPILIVSELSVVDSVVPAGVTSFAVLSVGAALEHPTSQVAEKITTSKILISFFIESSSFLFLFYLSLILIS
jgi:hypothetical protein